jgi:hypothetical protein
MDNTVERKPNGIVFVCIDSSAVMFRWSVSGDVVVCGSE